jgi:hypothetical protein
MGLSCPNRLSFTLLFIALSLQGTEVFTLQGTEVITGVFAQEPSESEGNQITFPTLVGAPDLELDLPMHLSFSDLVRIGRLRMEVRFPSPQLSFVRVQLVYQAERVGAEVSVQELEEGRIQVEIALPEKGEEALPQDGMASLLFRVSADVEPVPLTVVVENIEIQDLSGQPVEVLQNSEALIHIVSPELYPLISCFFYMH